MIVARKSSPKVKILCPIFEIVLRISLRGTFRLKKIVRPFPFLHEPIYTTIRGNEKWVKENMHYFSKIMASACLLHEISKFYSF